MMSTRVLGLGPSLRAAVFSPNLASRNRLALRAVFPKRSIQTQPLPPSAAIDILNKQRLRRPSSPHFTIYQPQLTWITSVATRITGASLSVLLYGFSLAYLVAPETFSSVNVIEFVAGLPDAVKYTGKAILASPFVFHSLSGVRHLVWDTGKFMTLKGVYGTGYTMLGLTAVGTIALVLM